jgi:hypothetical protein
MKKYLFVILILTIGIGFFSANTYASENPHITLTAGLFKSSNSNNCSLYVSQNFDNTSLVFTISNRGTTPDENAYCPRQVFRLQRIDTNIYEGQFDIKVANGKVIKTTFRIEALKNNSVLLTQSWPEEEDSIALFIQ